MSNVINIIKDDEGNYHLSKFYAEKLGLEYSLSDKPEAKFMSLVKVSGSKYQAVEMLNFINEDISPLIAQRRKDSF